MQTLCICNSAWRIPLLKKSHLLRMWCIPCDASAPLLLQRPKLWEPGWWQSIDAGIRSECPVLVPDPLQQRSCCEIQNYGDLAGTTAGKVASAHKSYTSCAPYCSGIIQRKLVVCEIMACKLVVFVANNCRTVLVSESRKEWRTPFAVECLVVQWKLY